MIRQLPWRQADCLSVDEILEHYNLTRGTARKYIDAIVQQNQSKGAEEADTSCQTVNTYQRAFREMTDTGRAAVISALAHEPLIERIETGDP